MRGGNGESAAVESDSTAVAALLGELALQMQAEEDSGALLRTIVRAGVHIMPGISWAGISLVRGKTVASEAPSDEVARALDRLQSELGEGPAISALADGRTVAIPDLAEETRWPRFVAAATESGVRCILAFRLFVQRGALGTLNLYGPQPHMFTDESVAVGEILAQHAAVAMVGAAAEEGARAAIESRDLIGQAKGIIMHRDSLDGLQAFALLTRASQDANVKLADVARLVVNEFEKGLSARRTRR
ncbi:GAF and ANTAR domain-containing protein [Mycobacterium sp. Marseille-P9652]|uniref:GAF and ANTAR domain-containing protein n=1 Tax=Mycobacterium sp. Marseille-P9652 TaxID=2654950 RepID=UPI0012E9731D|nr:GAF and ANTAR domain-containing protein [Mycobacterium sp. Marseille-P9652]